MDFFDRHKALIITSLLCSVLILALYNFNLSSKNQKVRELLVDLDNFQVEKPEEPEPEPEETPETTNRQTAQTHQAFNENQEARETNFDRQLQEIFEKNSAAQLESSNEDSPGTSGSFGMQQKKEEVKKRSDGDRSSEKTSTQSGGMDNSSITYSLLGRTAVHIPNPIYTCDRAGKIVVNITVNAEGRVLTTSINRGSSSTTNECLTEQAMQYATQAIFSRMAGRNSQPGTITYNFKP
ncbi:energy transducer TonB [Antarcticibacterium arcticum]|uniref:Energy transducer TonB n=1 Tax=Antarcticibacterium arcticum TaxID=2585771 RepID=A0A5B8YLZ5_9FLAO|nr:energy transducer TonB [Antarcticibacterium arcticum]QED38248.1 energy transducer TonB [Antarcticibacterium arcticum]